MRNSLLFVPANEKMLSKIGQLDADAYIIDLEDSIEEECKVDALQLVESFLDKYNFNNSIFVRVNKDRYIEEVSCLDKYSEIGFMLPKFEIVGTYEKGEEYFKRHEIIALVESPLGVVNIGDIVNCKWVDAIAFGAEDFVSFVNMKNENELLRYPKACLITYAKAYKKQVYDTPSFHLGLGEMFESDVRESVDLGFDGKLAISPKHVSVINQEFNRVDYDEIRRIIECYESSEEAVQIIDGIVYERMHIERLRKLLKEY